MSIAFCATAKALTQCLAQLPPTVSYTTFVSRHEPLDLAPLQPYATVLLEAGSTSSPSYQTAVGHAVSMLSIQDKSVILAPSIIGDTVLALPALVPFPGVQVTHYICRLRNSRDAEPLLQASGLRLLMLDGDVYAWYEVKQGYLSIHGAGCGVVFTRNTAAGILPAAVEISVITSGSGLYW
jgi:hypothetical protein